MGRRGKDRQENGRNVYRSLLLVTQFGINMLVPIGMTCALGIWLDKRFDASFWTILLFFVGAAAGGQNIYRMARQVYDGKGKKESEPVHEDNRDTEKKE